jgi:hypothetical protein
LLERSYLRVALPMMCVYQWNFEVKDMLASGNHEAVLIPF